MPEWRTPADIVSEIQSARGLSLYEARMEMFGELFAGVRKAKGIRDGIEQEIERGWFIGQIGQQGIDWEQSTMSKYGVKYTEIKILQIEPPHEDEVKLPEFDWDQFWVEVVKIFSTLNGQPAEALHHHMVNFCSSNFDGGPSGVEIRRKLALLSK